MHITLTGGNLYVIDSFIICAIIKVRYFSICLTPIRNVLGLVQNEGTHNNARNMNNIVTTITDLTLQMSTVYRSLNDHNSFTTAVKHLLPRNTSLRKR
jgi:hypothetical protein